MKQLIRIGDIIEFDDTGIVLGSVNGITTSSLVGDQLEIDQLSFRYHYLDKSGVNEVYVTKTGGGQILKDSNGKVYRLKTKPMPDLLSVPYATPVWYYQNNVLRLRMYVDHVERVSKTDFTVTCVSAIGLLDKQTHLGGLYAGQTVTQVLTDIIGGAVPFSVASDLASVRVYGWLPIETKRESIHQVLFAHGANLTKNANGDLYFCFLQQTSVKQIPNSRIFLGGRSTYTPPSTRIEVVEHSYFQSQYDETVTLFDNSDPTATAAGNTFITFADAPCYNISASAGLTVNSYGVNWAIISGKGVLTGKKYAHQTGLAVRNNPNSTGFEKVVTSKNCTLVSMLTSANVTRRLLSYYASAQKFVVDLVRSNENVGDQVQFVNPFGETITGFLGRMDWRVTSLERSQADVVMNYEPTPSGGGGGYSHVAVITASGTWTVPSGVLDITIVLIGGGQGGQGGRNGAAGTAGTGVTSTAGQTKNSAGGTGGAGGAAGTGGSCGRVFQAMYEVSAGANLSISIGAGGAGGAVGGGAGSNGGNTTLSGGGISASSANGVVPTNGFYDVINKSTYALAGTGGTAGAAGGAGGNASNNNGVRGSNVGSRSGGNAGSVVSSSAATSAWRNPSRSVPNKISSTEQYIGTTYGKSLNPDNALQPISGYWIDYWDYNRYNGDIIPDLIINQSNGNITVPSSYQWTTNIRPLDGAWSREPYSMDVYYRNGYIFTVNGKRLTVYHYSTEWIYESGIDNPQWEIYLETDVFETYYETITPDWTAKQFAGGGGGASATANGGNASNNNGGAGANASAPSVPTVRGSGGTGGNGGGGGAGGGGASVTAKAGYTTAKTVAGGSAGAGGTGSAGSDGAAGCVLIYY